MPNHMDIGLVLRILLTLTMRGPCPSTGFCSTTSSVTRASTGFVQSSPSPNLQSHNKEIREKENRIDKIEQIKQGEIKKASLHATEVAETCNKGKNAK